MQVSRYNSESNRRIFGQIPIMNFCHFWGHADILFILHTQDYFKRYIKLLGELETSMDCSLFSKRIKVVETKKNWDSVTRSGVLNIVKTEMVDK